MIKTVKKKGLFKLLNAFIIFSFITVLSSKGYAVKSLLDDNYNRIDFDGAKALSKTIAYTNSKVHKVGIEHIILEDNLQEFKMISLQHEGNKPEYFRYNSDINKISCKFCSKSLTNEQKHKIQNTGFTFIFDTYNGVNIKLIFTILFMAYLIASPLKFSLVNLILSIIFIILQY